MVIAVPDFTAHMDDFVERVAVSESLYKFSSHLSLLSDPSMFRLNSSGQNYWYKYNTVIDTIIKL